MVNVCDLIRDLTNMAMLCPKNSCDKHYNEDITAYCEECRQKICKLCKELHKEQGHNVKSLHQKAGEITLNLSTTIKTTYLPQHKKQHEEIQETQKINERLYNKAETAILERKEQLLEWLEKETKMQLCQCKKQYEETRVKLEELESKLSKTISEYNKYANFFENTAKTTSSFEIVNTAEELELKSKTISDTEFKGVKSFQYSFQSSKFSQKEFKNIFGSMIVPESDTMIMSEPKDISLDFKRKLKCKSRSKIVDVVLFSKTKAWVNAEGADSIYQGDVTSSSVTEDMIPLNEGSEIEGITITKQNDIILSDYKFRCLWKWSNETNTTFKLHSWKDLHPYGLCSTSNNSILICLNERDPFDEVNKQTMKSKRSITEVSFKGQEAQEVDRITSQLNFPIRVAESKGDIAIVDRFYPEDQGCIVIASHGGKEKKVYKGQNLRHPFDPMYITYDNNCRLLVCDCQNSAIHMLDKNGDFVRFLLRDARLKPFSFSMYDDSMWVGTDEGIICVYALKFVDET